MQTQDIAPFAASVRELSDDALDYMIELNPDSDARAVLIAEREKRAKSNIVDMLPFIRAGKR